MQEEDKPRNEDEILALCLERLRGKLPPGWDSMVLREGPAAAGLADGLLRITAPDGTQATFVLKVKISATTKGAVVAVDQMIRILAESEETNWMPLFVTGYLPPRTRELLNQRGVGWIDTTGNLRIISSSPGLFIEATGAIRDPWPDDQPLRSLRGRGSARAVRAVVDFTPPYGVRELSTTARVPAPTLSRVLELLTQEMIVERDAAGGVVDVDWEAAIRRWSKDFILRETKLNRVSSYLEPRGLDSFVRRLASSDLQYSVTGSLAASKFAPVAPTRQVALYIEKPAQAAAALDLRPAPSGGNVLLVSPFDPVVFDRTLTRDGLTIAALGQVATDLLMGPGREPAEAERLIEWMKENLRAWRS